MYKAKHGESLDKKCLHFSSYLQGYVQSYYTGSFNNFEVSYTNDNLKVDWQHASRILWNYIESLSFWKRGEETLTPDKKDTIKSSIKKALLIGMMAGSATAMGNSDLVLSSTKNKMSSIFEKNKNHGHLNTLNLSIEDRNTVRQVAKSLPSRLFLPSTTAINLISDTG